MPINTIGGNVAYIPRTPRTNAAVEEREASLVINGEVVDDSNSATDSPVPLPGYESFGETNQNLTPSSTTVVIPPPAANETANYGADRFASLLSSQDAASPVDSIPLAEGAFVSRIETPGFVFDDAIASYTSTQNLLSNDTVPVQAGSPQRAASVDVFI